ncbi:hypothetical protein [Streptomyces sp. NPDC046712]|uniref:hypothetical protein n=1 Tax=Streptomyces sp. NPDC046712 TaxID=3154802 RepID=UPI0033FCB55F
MSFDDEWASARAAAATNASMRLNQVPADPGPSGPGTAGKDLAVDDDHIGRIGSEAFRLHNMLRGDGAHARRATDEAAVELTGGKFESGAALRTVHDKWNRQVDLLVAACANISNHCDYTVVAWVAHEEKLIATMRVSEIDQYLK